MLEFLSELFEEGLGYSTLDTARSAISVSAVFNFDQGRPVGAHPKVIRFMKGLSELRTPKHSQSLDLYSTIF